MTYVEAIRQAIDDSLASEDKMLVLGQGLWSPFYVGRSMDELDSKYGRDRVIDTPVSENAVTGIALGVAISGGSALVVHPRMDFMILATDQIVNEAAKWRYVLGQSTPLRLTIRGIINRGGEQGAQHSQALHSWFAHVPGLRVVMPAVPRDAYALLRQSIECPDPTVFVEDRWSYGIEEDFELPPKLSPLAEEGPRRIRDGDQVTLVGIGHSTNVCRSASDELSKRGIECDIVDCRVLSPFSVDTISESVLRTRRLLVVDGGWRIAGMAAEIIASVAESIDVSWLTLPRRVTLPNAPAPSSAALERLYYISVDSLVTEVESAVAAG